MEEFTFEEIELIKKTYQILEVNGTQIHLLRNPPKRAPQHINM